MKSFDLVKIKRKEKDYLLSNIKYFLDNKCERNFEEMDETGTSPLENECHFRVYFHGLQDREERNSYIRKTTTEVPKLDSLKYYGKKLGCPPGTKRIIFESYELPLIYLFDLNVEEFYEVIEKDNIFMKYVFTAKSIKQIINRFLKRYFRQYSAIDKKLSTLFIRSIKDQNIEFQKDSNDAFYHREVWTLKEFEKIKVRYGFSVNTF